MEHDYLLNPAIELCLEHIEPGSGEKEVQAFWENTLWTVFPATDYWMNLTKYKQGATEPDNKTMKLRLYNTGWAPIDVLVVELKKDREDKSLKAFNRVADDLLDDHMAESTNPDGTTLFGAVGIGQYVQFYQRVLPRGKLVPRHQQPLHLKTNAQDVQGHFNHFKVNIPRTRSQIAAPPAAASYASVPSANPAVAAAASSGSVPFTYSLAPTASHGGTSSANLPVTAAASYGGTSSANAPVAAAASYGGTSSANAPVAAAASFGGTSSATPTMASSSHKVVTPTAAAGSPQAELPEQYYFVQEKKHYYYDNGSVVAVDRPMNQWVRNERGWSETDRKKIWRYWDGKKTFYED